MRLHKALQLSGVLTCCLSVAGLVSLPTSAVAQTRDRAERRSASPDSNKSKITTNKTQRGPRAIAVLEFLPNGNARLVPVALLIDGHFYDASLYAANPEPMAVEPGTVYEATDYGESTGLFTVTNPKEIKGNWVGDGKWKPRQALDEKLAEQAAKQPKPKKTTNADDDRPLLRHPGSTNAGGEQSPAASSGNGPQQAPPSPATEDPDRPILKKPVEQTPPAATANSSSPNSNAAAQSPEQHDSDRPVLRRGKSEASQAADVDEVQPPKSPASASGTQNKSQAPPALRRSSPAVSDAGAYETRSLLYSMTPEERTSRLDNMRTLALGEIRKFVSARHTPALPSAATIDTYDFRSYDLDFSNSPTLVLTATLPVPGAKAFGGGAFSYFVTVVAREDINSSPIKIFSMVSDSNHLDAFPRMEVIDAVDADANGRGDLLFRQYSDTGISYSVYRVFPYDMQKVFEGGSGV
jgi:hypothetical protein